ncbi:MAG: D-tyrosyl-tRNA(Tyr) deacylase [Rhodospirillaceae bacterium]|nr:D-tyrosyl-tRNA(Tyr) deacylase [Rhodospirillaceae bacterium]
MKTILQRVSEANVSVDGEVVGAIGQGLLVLFCAETSDSSAQQGQIDYFARKIATMRIFEDGSGKMNLSVKDIGGSALVISQFTLAAEWRNGNRPSFSGAASPDVGKALYDGFCAALADQGLVVETGEFGARMEVSLVNSGPVTIVMDDS